MRYFAKYQYIAKSFVTPPSLCKSLGVGWWCKRFIEPLFEVCNLAVTVVFWGTAVNFFLDPCRNLAKPR